MDTDESCTRAPTTSWHALPCLLAVNDPSAAHSEALYRSGATGSFDDQGPPARHSALRECRGCVSVRPRSACGCARIGRHAVARQIQKRHLGHGRCARDHSHFVAGPLVPGVRGWSGPRRGGRARHAAFHKPCLPWAGTAANAKNLLKIFVSELSDLNALKTSA